MTSVPHPQKSLLFPAFFGFSDAVRDVADIPDGATSVRLVEKVLNFEALPNRRGLTKLWCFGVDDRRLRILASCESLTQLFMNGLRVADLSPLARGLKLETLSLDTALKIQSLDWVAAHGDLKRLSITHFRSVTSLGPLAGLTQLQALAVAGSMWTRMTVESLAPLSNLTKLTFLHLTNLKPVDASLEPLHGLTALEELECANFYPMEEFAKLAAALRQTRCDWFEPCVRFPHVACKKCGQQELVLLTGMGARTLCRACDQKRVRKHEDAFWAIAGP
jgi:hypothetical protein